MMATMDNSIEYLSFATLNQQTISEATSCFIQNFNAWNANNNIMQIQINDEDDNEYPPECMNEQDINENDSFNEPQQIEPKNTTVVIGNPNDLKDSTEYELIIYREMLESEIMLPSQNVVQTEITPKDRGLLVDWLCRVHYKCRLTTSIFYRCIGIIDRLLMVTVIPSEDLKLIGCASMLIASKIEGQPFYISHAIELSEHSFNREMIINAEAEINNLLGFQLNFPTSFTFLSHLQRLSEERSECVLHSRYLIEVCSSSIEFINVRPSAIACTAILLTRILHGYDDDAWTDQMEEYTGYSFSDLIGYAKIIHSFLLEEDREETVFMRRKYGSPAFHCVADYPLPCVI